MKPGPGMFISRYIEQKGGGINHIAFNTDDIERDTQHFKDLGCELVFNVSVNGNTIENYIDTRLHGDLMISLRPEADSWEKSWRENNQSHPLVKDWTFFGIGLCVNDINAAVNYYSKLGFVRASDIGCENEWGVNSQNFSIGKIHFVLINAFDNTIYSKSLQQRGEGLSEIIFEVPDLDRALIEMEKRGVKTLIVSEDKSMASIDTREKGNILTKLIQKA